MSSETKRHEKYLEERYNQLNKEVGIVRFKLVGDFNSRVVALNGQLLNPTKAELMMGTFPTGFSWGYDGLGSKKLALAILLELNFPNMQALYQSQSLKDQLIDKLPVGSFEGVYTFIPSTVIVNEKKEEENQT